MVERWLLPDRSDLVELSIKVEPGEATTASEEFLDLLEESSASTSAATCRPRPVAR